MKRSQRWNTLQICPQRGWNSDGSDLCGLTGSVFYQRHPVNCVMYFSILIDTEGWCQVIDWCKENLTHHQCWNLNTGFLWKIFWIAAFWQSLASCRIYSAACLKCKLTMFKCCTPQFLISKYSVPWSKLNFSSVNTLFHGVNLKRYGQL